MNRRTGVTLAFSLSLFLLACQQKPAPAPDTRAADESAVRTADIDMAQQATNKSLDALVAYYAEDATMLPPNAPIVIGKEAIRAAWEKDFALPGFALRWQPVQVQVARSGDLAYTRGTYEMTVNDAKGKPVTDKGKYVVVWKKQADGSWKDIEDIYNSDLPAPKM